MRLPATPVDVDVPGFHPPSQRRSRDTLERLNERMEAILIESGPAALSVRDLVARTGTSVGAFYARFDDKGAALSYASAAFWERSRRTWAAYLAEGRWAHASAAGIVASVVRTFSRAMLADAERLRAFSRAVLLAPDRDLTRRVAEHDRFIASTLGGLLASRKREIRHPAPREAAELGGRRILSAVRDYVVYEAAEAHTPGEERAFILGLVQMYARYLDVHPVPVDYDELLEVVSVGRIKSPP